MFHIYRRSRYAVNAWVKDPLLCISFHKKSLFNNTQASLSLHNYIMRSLAILQSIYYLFMAKLSENGNHHHVKEAYM